MTNVSFDQNHGSGQENAPPLLGGRCEQRLALAPCRTCLLETRCWISPVRLGHRLLFLAPAGSVSGALPAACWGLPGSPLLHPIAPAQGIPWMGANRKWVYP